jgi:hypothetical protein
MNKIFALSLAAGTVFSFTAITLHAQPYTFDGNGNGTDFPLGAFGGPSPMSFQITSDPTGGITSSPVLIYSLGYLVVSGDVALTASDGTTVLDLFRFYTPSGSSSSDLILYSQIDGGTDAADVGIPSSSSPVVIREANPYTFWIPPGGQPGAPTQGHSVSLSFLYTFVKGIPEPSIASLLLATPLVALLRRRQGRTC